jgi:hypothetical protein
MAEDRTAARHTTRRRIVGMLGAGLFAAVAGCAEGRPHGPPETEQLVSETLQVPPGTYETWRFSLDAERWLTVGAVLSDRSVEVELDGPAVDVFVVSPDAVARFRRGESFDYLRGVSMPDVVNGEVAASVSAGEYALVVDNTKRGSAAPDGSGVDAVVDVAVTAATERPHDGSGSDPTD